jgi:hypothetical protein
LRLRFRHRLECPASAAPSGRDEAAGPARAAAEDAVRAAEAKAAEEARQAPDEAIRVLGASTRGVPFKRRSSPQLEGVDRAELALLPRLPDTVEELKSIAVALNADPSKVLNLGVAANEHTVKSADLTKYKIVVFATHGLVAGELEGLTQPALALSAPEVAAVPGDGLLTMEEILGLKLNADWVVLSACNTGAASGAGGEAASGLGRAFFYAGTRAILVTNWSVHSESARELMADLFRRQSADPTLTRGEALRQAMMAGWPGIQGRKRDHGLHLRSSPILGTLLHHWRWRMKANSRPAQKKQPGPRGMARVGSLPAQGKRAWKALRRIPVACRLQWSVKRADAGTFQTRPGRQIVVGLYFPALNGRRHRRGKAGPILGGFVTELRLRQKMAEIRPSCGENATKCPMSCCSVPLALFGYSLARELAPFRRGHFHSPSGIRPLLLAQASR